MKRIILIAILMLAGLSVALTANVCGANQPVKPLIDHLLQPPNSVWQTYGHSEGEDTLRLYNIIANMQSSQSNESKITSLRAEITSLRAEVTKLKETVKNIEALIKANAATLTTLTTSELKQTLKNLEVVVEANALTVTPAAEPKDSEETRTGCDK